MGFRTHRPFDVVHIVHSAFPEDARPRREAMIAAVDGASVAVIALQDGVDRARVGRFGPIRVVRLPGRRQRGSFGKYVLEYTDFVARAWALMRRDARFRGARVVHVHSLPDFLVAAAGPARRRGARVILDLHEILPEFVQTKFGGVGGALAAPLARWLERWSRRRADVTLTVNRSTDRLLRSRPARHDERIEIIHNLTSSDDLGPEQLRLRPARSPVRLVYHGTLTRLYGLDLAIDAIAQCRSAGLQVTLDIFGRGPEAPALQSQIAAHRLATAVTLCGVATHAVLRELLPTYDAGLLPTRLDAMTRHSLSTKLLEYVHLGIPVIAPRLPTYADYFSDDSAYYFAPNDSADAARAVAAFAADTATGRRAHAERAQTALAALNWATEGQKLRGIYRELLQTDG